MNKHELSRPLAIAIGAALIGAVATANANEGTFSIRPLASPYMMTADDTAAGGKEAEGKCGSDKAKEGKCGSDKAKEGKCGEGKCGSDKEGDAEGKEPGNKDADA